MKLFLRTSLLTFLFSIAYACSDPCEGVYCENDGVCVDGHCSCPEGLSGRECEIELRDTLVDSYIGYWEENFNRTTVGVTIRHSVVGPTVVYMDFTSGYRIYANMTGPFSFDIKPQSSQPQSYSYSGSGYIEGNKLFATFELDSPYPKTVELTLYR